MTIWQPFEELNFFPFVTYVAITDISRILSDTCFGGPGLVGPENMARIMWD